MPLSCQSVHGIDDYYREDGSESFHKYICSVTDPHAYWFWRIPDFDCVRIEISKTADCYRWWSAVAAPAAPAAVRAAVLPHCCHHSTSAAAATSAAALVSNLQTPCPSLDVWMRIRVCLKLQHCMLSHLIQLTAVWTPVPCGQQDCVGFL